MKKLFTLIAFLAVVMGARAEWVKIFTVDYSQFTGFPYYVMGFVPEWNDGVMTDLGGGYTYTPVAEATEPGVSVFTNSGAEYIRTEKTDGTWHQYFIADGINTELDGAYTVKAMVKASEACSINVNMGWGWGSGESVGTQVSIGTDWQEVEWDYTGINGTKCNLVAQPNTTAQIEWKYVEVWQNKKAQRPVEWIEYLENGDAEKPWADSSIKFNDAEKNFTICAWSKEKGYNVNETGGSDPHPALIEAVEDGHAFVVHGAVADTEGDAAAWDNQFWIESPKAWKIGSKVKISFRYKASKACEVGTQLHNQQPSDYLHWQAIGNINFTQEWQTYSEVVTIPSNEKSLPIWSVAFNLNSGTKEAVDFYFDDLSWQEMKLDEGFFVASANAENGISYDYDNAAELVYDASEDAYIAVVGEKGKKNTWINEVMISTKRGEDQSFKSNTIKPAYVKDDAQDWAGYEAATNYKVKLPAAGVWQISVAPESDESGLINFVKLEGDEEKEPVVIVPNPTVITLEGAERISADWDNQLWIIANRLLEQDEVTVIEFDYECSLPEARTGTQCQGMYGEGQFDYLHWSALGDVVFKNEVQHFTKEYKVAADAAVKEKDSHVYTAHGIVFNMACIEEACNYTIKNVVWKTQDGSESLIDMTDGRNFWLKSAGGAPVCAGIENVTVNTAASKAAYNIAGQRVSNNYKGIVVKNGSKYIVK